MKLRGECTRLHVPVLAALCAAVAAGCAPRASAERPLPFHARAPRPREAHAIGEVIHRGRVAVTACYWNARSRRPALEGLLRLRLVLAPDGEVVYSAVERSTLGVPDVDECVARAVGALRFPPTENGDWVMFRWTTRIALVP